MTTPQDIINFWFNEQNEANWFKSSDKFDREIEDKFGELYRESKSQLGVEWSETAVGMLAAVILFDQLPRNLFRDSPDAFASDALALQYAKKAISLGLDAQLTAEQNQFLYMPFMHSEDKAVQEECIALYETLNRPGNLEFAIKHKAIIDRFGRYPHRNKALGRESTPEEIAFLKEPGSSF